VIGSIAKNTEGTNKPIELKKAIPANQTTSVSALPGENDGSRAHGFEPVPADRHARGSERWPVPVRPQVRKSERPAAGPAAKDAVRRTDGPLVKSQSSKLPERAVAAGQHPAVENERSHATQSSPAQPRENTATPAASPSASVPGGTALAEMKEKEIPSPSSNDPVAPAAPTWSVSVSTDPYPSIRIPPEISSQKLTQGRTLQIGHVVSRVEPVYPEDAKHQGVEGTVKVHVIVGRDGAVQSVEPTGGPALLAKAATSAVREWRYAQTLLGGQPVETEQDIVVKFRLVSPSMARN
jgi:TonB family protein